MSRGGIVVEQSSVDEFVLRNRYIRILTDVVILWGTLMLMIIQLSHNNIANHRNADLTIIGIFLN